MFNISHNPLFADRSQRVDFPASTEFKPIFRLQYFAANGYVPTQFFPHLLFGYVKSGKGNINVNGTVFELRPNTLFWLQPYHVFQINPDWQNDIVLHYFAADYGLVSYWQFCDYGREELDSFFADCPIIHPNESEHQKAQKLFAAFAREDERNDRHSPSIKYGIFAELTCQFFHCFMRAASEGYTFKKTVVWNILQEIGQNCNKNLELSQMARRFNTMPEKINHQLKLLCGEDFQGLLNRFRINLACNIMVFQDLSNQYISSLCGYTNMATFYRHFKFYKGMTPSCYRSEVVLQSIYQTVQEKPWSILCYIVENYLSPLTVKTVGQALYINSNSINPLLVEAFGYSFNDLVAHFRLLHAEALLLTTDLSALDVAISSGYNCKRTFELAFRKRTGMTATEYRSFHQKEGGVNV